MEKKQTGKSYDYEIEISGVTQEFEKKDVVEALKSIGVSVTANMREGTLLSKAGELDEEKTSALKEALGIE